MRASTEGTLPSTGRTPLLHRYRAARSGPLAAVGALFALAVLLGSVPGAGGTPWSRPTGGAFPHPPGSASPPIRLGPTAPDRGRSLSSLGAPLGWSNLSFGTYMYNGSSQSSPIVPARFPEQFRGMSLVYDGTDHYDFLFGGVDWAADYSQFAWMFARNNWTDLTSTYLNNVSAGPSPDAREHAAMAYDPAAGAVVLFGGIGSGSAGSGLPGSVFGDTWSWSHDAWTNLSPNLTAAPSPRYGAAMTYDPAEDALLLFGGYAENPSTSVGHPLRDTWEFTNGSWRNVTASVGIAPPVPCCGWVSAQALPSMVWDSTDGIALLTIPSARPWGTETWEFLNHTWVNRTAASGPEPTFRTWSALADDPALGGVVRFGGAAADEADPTNDTWLFVHGTWTLWQPDRTPDGPGGGGQTGPGPTARFDAALAYDPGSRCLVLTGGRTDGYNWPNDTWALCGSTPVFDNSSRVGPDPGSFVGGWVDRTNRSAPAPPYTIEYSSTITSAVNGSVLVFSGTQNEIGGGPHRQQYNLTWLWKGGAWTNATASGGAPPNASCTGSEIMTYDAHDGYPLLFGGADWCSTSESYKFVNGTWRNLSVANPPPYFGGGAWITYDAADGYVLLLGFWNRPTGLAETWSYAGGVWTNLTAKVGSAPPYGGPWTESGAMTYDSTDGYVVYIGQNSSSGGMDTWSYVAGKWTDLTSLVAGVPGCRSWPAITDDPTAGGVLVFGGYGCYPGSGDWGDTWLYSAHKWIQVFASPGPGGGSPSPRDFASLTFDPTTGCAILTGGADPFEWGEFGYAGEVWQYCSDPANRTPTNGAVFPSTLGPQLTFSVNATSGSAPFATNVTVTPTSGLPPFAVVVCVGGACQRSTVAQIGTPWTASIQILHAGDFQVNLSITDARDRVAKAAFQVHVSPTPPLTGNLEASQSVGTAPLVVLFVANVGGGLPPYQVTWTFGDGDSSAGAPGTPIAHTYRSAGSYEATAEIKDRTGQWMNLSSTPIVVGARSGAAVGAIPPLGGGLAVLAGVVTAVGIAALGVVIAVRYRERRRAREIASAIAADAGEGPEQTGSGGST